MKVYLENSDAIDSILEIDEYVPVIVRFPKNNTGSRTLVYYNFIDYDSSIIGFAIDSKSKKIVKLTIIAIESFVVEDLPKSLLAYPANPVFEVSEVEGKFRSETEIIDIKVVVSDNVLEFNLYQEETNKVITTEYLDFKVGNDNKLIGFRIKNFSAAQWQEIVNILDL